MTAINKKEPFVLSIGDITILVFSLWLTLVVRYHALPDASFWQAHLLPFSFIFLYSIIIFYIAGLYGQYGEFFYAKTAVIIKSQIVNILLAVALFYFVPNFLVSPKTTLFIYFIISSGLLFVWRIMVFYFLGTRKKSRAFVIGDGAEVEEMCKEMNANRRSSLECVEVISSKTASSSGFHTILSEKIEKEKISYIVLDINHESLDHLLPELYKTHFKDVHFIDIYHFYEGLFWRIPLSCLKYAWVLENISPTSPKAYDILKRSIDIILALILVVITLILWPFVWLAIKLDDHGPAFIIQKRVGRNNRIIEMYKFRSMRASDGGKWLSENDDRVTRVGHFLRKSRIDELPQVWSVLKGDMSLIGPRPDIRDLGDALAKEIPYYNIRTVIKPGLSGWAQVNQAKPPQSLDETKLRLSYDLFYIKNRSLWLDIRIALRTIKTLLSLGGM